MSHFKNSQYSISSVVMDLLQWNLAYGIPIFIVTKSVLFRAARNVVQSLRR